MKIIFAFALAATLFLGCKTEKTMTESTETEETTVNEPVKTTETEPTKPKKPYRVKAQLGDLSQRSDPFEIKNARIEGNLLLLEITYSGGCAWHKFECIGSEAVMKSLPPQRSLRLIHDNDNDSCEGIVHESLEIDISSLAISQTAGSEIVLILEGLNETLNYVYE